MRLISYAQNLEDVMLWRALNDVKNGFYIDVGANDPEVDSVTKTFYDKGWRGINIEPCLEWYRKLQEQRPRDMNLQLAAGSGCGEITLFEFVGTGLSTRDSNLARNNQMERGIISKKVTVQMQSLDTICNSYHVKTVHFLKIDVEGSEAEVIRGINFQKMRPWIILVESTLPNSHEENYQEWDPILLGSGYQFVYFDGLNRYYLADEHSERKSCFNAPPNVLDRYIYKSHHSAILLSNELAARLSELEIRCQASESNANHWHLKAQHLHYRLQLIYRSYSWRLTAPLRVLHRLIIGDATVVREIQETCVNTGKFILRPLVYILIGLLFKIPVLRTAFEYSLKKYPRMHQEYIGFACHHGFLINPDANHQSLSGECISYTVENTEWSNLTPRARQIYGMLQNAIQKKQGS